MLVEIEEYANRPTKNTVNGFCCGGMHFRLISFHLSFPLPCPLSLSPSSFFCSWVKSTLVVLSQSTLEVVWEGDMCNEANRFLLWPHLSCLISGSEQHAWLSTQQIACTFVISVCSLNISVGYCMGADSLQADAMLFLLLYFVHYLAWDLSTLFCLASVCFVACPEVVHVWACAVPCSL